MLKSFRKEKKRFFIQKVLLFNKEKKEESEGSEMFGYASKYISDELELVHDQQENILQVSKELEKAFSQIDKMKKLLQIVKKIDKTVMQKQIKGKRRQESKMINTMEEIKRLLKDGRYEDIDRLMAAVKHGSHAKIMLSTEEIRQLRNMMEDIIELYQEAAGLCRLYIMVYDHIKEIYDQCEREIGFEATEETELSRAGSYTESVRPRI